MSSLEWLQVDFRWRRSVAPVIAAQLGVSRAEVVDQAISLWAWALDVGRCPLLVPGAVIETMVEWKGEPGRWVTVASGSFAELLEAQPAPPGTPPLEREYRVRGLSRYGALLAEPGAPRAYKTRGAAVKACDRGEDALLLDGYSLAGPKQWVSREGAPLSWPFDVAEHVAALAKRWGVAVSKLEEEAARRKGGDNKPTTVADSPPAVATVTPIVRTAPAPVASPPPVLVQERRAEEHPVKPGPVRTGSGAVVDENFTAAWEFFKRLQARRIARFGSETMEEQNPPDNWEDFYRGAMKFLGGKQEEAEERFLAAFAGWMNTDWAASRNPVGSLRVFVSIGQKGKGPTWRDYLAGSGKGSNSTSDSSEAGARLERQMSRQNTIRATPKPENFAIGGAPSTNDF